MKRLLCLGFICFTLQCFGQKDFNGGSWSFKDRGYFGLGLGGLNISPTSTGTYFSAGLNGQVGYMLTENLSTGIGAEYQYTSYGNKIHSNVYNGYPFVRYNIKNCFLQADYDYYNVKVAQGSLSDRRFYNRCFVGLGFSSPTNNGGRFNALISYDILDNGSSQYFTSPYSIRFYATF